MLTFKYTARDPATGQKQKSIVQAESESAAAKLIKQQGLVPIDISVEKAGNPTNPFNRIKSKDKVLFSRQMSTLINAGLPLVQSLRSTMKQTTSKPLKLVLGQVIGDVEGGSSLSQALAKHPEAFNEIFIGLITAGEASGTLDTAMERIADQQEKDAEILSKVRGAMVYPAVVILVMLAVITFMIVKVLPQVQVLYNGLPGNQLPILTRVLLGLSHLVTRFWWLILILIALGGVFGFRWIKTVGGRRLMDRLKMKAWPVGPLFMKLYMARFARTANTLVGSGVPLLQMMDITGRAINNVYIQESLKAASEKVKGGKSLSESISKDPNFLELVPNMISIGEQSGALEAMLGKVADYYEKEVDNQIKAISTIIEPVMMIILGVVAMIIVAAVLLPVYSLAGKSFIN